MQLIVTQSRQHRRTTFFSSHLIDEVERCADRVGMIHAGRMRFEGPLGSLRATVRRVRVTGDAEFNPPPEFERWLEAPLDGARLSVLRAPEEAWNALVLPEGARVESLSLEDAFIACVGAKAVRL
jgi:ABC-2 type transport system ATP-binding protein